MIEPRYPVYVISKGRSDRCLTARFMRKDGLDFKLVVEPTEADAYAAEFGRDRLLVLPFHDLGLGSIPARNWCWEHSLEAGAARHWIFDDNIMLILRWEAGRRLPCDSRVPLRLAEDFTERYANVGITGFNYAMFGTGPAKPFRLNNHVYSSLLIDNAMPYRWRGRYNEDTDLCLQVLSGDLCIVQINAYLIQKVGTMVMKGGNTDDLYRGDGRLEMARSLERAWPGVVTVERRFQRPQHVVDWSRFRTPLVKRPPEEWPEPVDYSMMLERVRPPRPVLRGKLRRTDEKTSSTE